MLKRIQSLSFLIISIGIFLAYFPSLFYGFSQDDFIHLYSSNASTVLDFFNFFNPFATFPDIFFYRPLSTQFFYFSLNSLFGLNAFYYHLVQILFHIGNGILFYFLVKRIWKDSTIAFLSALLFGISSVHFLSLFYIGAFQQILKTFLVFLSLFFYLKYLDRNQLKWISFSLLTFVLSLLSKEGAIITPLLIVALHLSFSQTKRYLSFARNDIKILIPYFVIVGVYLLIRFIGIQTIFTEGAYQYSFSILNIFQNLKWYLLWTLGLPEIIATYPSLSIQSMKQFSADYPQGLWIIISFITISMIFLISLSQIKKVSSSLLSLSCLLFILPLLPVLVLVGHKYPHYLDVSLLGVLPIIMYLIQKTPYSKLILISFLIGFGILQFLAISLSQQTHWTTHRANVATHYHQKLQSFSDISSKQKLIFVGNETQLQEISYALAMGYGPKIWYPNLMDISFSTLNPESIDDKTLVIPVTLY